ncbi:MAG: CBS domain-containing protein [Chloroflexi bacterium]|nr:CBS domain-containing protein [Chloroflexota bacterium]MBP8058565.1 CBS domain-containing protein [Chloroflexota bacterium]
MREALVKDWMTYGVVTITPDTTLPVAHKIMTENEVRRLPVVDKEGKLIGIVTLSDIRSAETSPTSSLSVWELNYLLSRLTVEELMAPNPFTITADSSIGKAALSMLEHKISGLPVVDDEGVLIGIITESDIFSMVVLHEWKARELDEEEDEHVPPPGVTIEVSSE